MLPDIQMEMPSVNILNILPRMVISSLGLEYVGFSEKHLWKQLTAKAYDILKLCFAGKVYI